MFVDSTQPVNMTKHIKYKYWFLFLNISILEVNILLKTFITHGLSFLILSSTFHVDLHHEDYHEGNSICNIDCGNENHHSASHHCEKCLVKNHKSPIQTFVDISTDSQVSSFKFSNKTNIACSIFFSLYSRPPPKTIS